LSTLTPATLNQLKTVFPEWMPPANPVDMWPAIILNGSKKVYSTAMEAVCADPGVDAVFIHCFAGGFSLETDLEQMAQTARKAGKPLFCWISGERERVYEFQQKAQRIGIPVFREILRAVECIGMLLNRPQVNQTLVNRTLVSRTLANQAPAGADHTTSGIGVDPRLDILASGKGQLDEYASKTLLAAWGIPVVEEKQVTSLEQALQAAERFGFPLVAKGILPGVSHKTESDLVQLGITSEHGLENAVKTLEQILQGRGSILVQKQVAGRIELVAGFVRDPRLGPCVMCGLGGIFAEALNDTVFGIAPLKIDDALSMIDRLKCQPILDGCRGLDPVDKNEFARILVALGDLGSAYPHIREIDINPFIIHKSKPIAVDGLVVISKDNSAC
jgi:acetyltransferase